MRVLVAGATGAIGRRLVPELISRSHHVVGPRCWTSSILDGGRARRVGTRVSACPS